MTPSRRVTWQATSDDERAVGKEVSSLHCTLTGDLSVAGERGRWRIARLWTTKSALLPACRQPGRQGSARRKAGRSANRATQQVRAGREPEDRRRHRPDDPTDPAAARRRGDRVKRRAFITLLGGAAAWPLAARAQQGDRMRRIGVLTAGTDANDPDAQSRIAAFLQAMQQLGWADG